MIWLSHKKYTESYLSAHYDKLYSRIGKRNRNMVYVATTATFVMTLIQTGYLYKLIGV